jgi:hypothetical protein
LDRPVVRQGQLATVRVVGDALLVVGGQPFVWRVVETQPGTVTGFKMEPVPGEVWEGAAGPPRDLFPAKLLIYRKALAVATELLKPVDVLHIWSGESQYGTQAEGYYLWQGALGLTPLTLMEVRGALQSPWVYRQRTGRQDANRGIILRS